MSLPHICRNQHILVIDDNRAIHEDFRKILGKRDDIEMELDEAEARIFGSRPKIWFDIDTASQGEEGLVMVKQAVACGRPYALAFVDVRMPPGWDGIETTRRIWEVCPDLQIVICTAYADRSWEEMQQQIQPGDRLLILKKPFDTIEVLQMANALSEKWRLQQQSKLELGGLDKMVKQRTQELEDSRLAAFKMMEDAVQNREKAEHAHEELKREVEERIKLEEQLREKASLLDKAQDAILVRGLDHKITYWNKSAERLYGWTAKEARGRSVAELLYQDTTIFQKACEQLFKLGEWTGELHQHSKDGKELTIEGRWTLVRDSANQPKAVLAINTDVTERKKLELQFLRAQRIEGIGTLAGGIAHDLNNVLTPITLAIDLLALTVKDKRSLDVLHTIAASAKRGADMVGQVLTFARGMEGSRIDVRVKDLAGDIQRICNDTFPKNIDINTSIDQDLWAVQGDPTQLHQVLLNLCVNARDAMPKGGRLTITCENISIDERYAAMDLQAKPGSYVCLQVEDTGTGMPQHVVERIFDPFFTTKDIGKGTGLGLSTSMTIVKSHGGFIQVSSEPGKGTRFRVFLEAKSEESTLDERREALELPRGAGQTVLVVDDEAAVRLIAKQTLEAFGYRVMLASDGAEAVAIYAQEHQHIDVALIDMAMPVMSGDSTVKVLTRLNPSVRIITASGVSAHDRKADAGDGEEMATRFVQKPYTADVLLKALRDVLATESVAIPV
jgi:PAS domain S-box-containing protein